MEPRRPIGLILLLCLLGGGLTAVEEQPAPEGVGIQRDDKGNPLPTTSTDPAGNTRDLSSSGVHTELEAAAQRIKQLVGLSDAPEGLVQRVKTENADTMRRTERARGSRPRQAGLSLGLPGASLQIGGSIEDLDSPYDYFEMPETVSFIKEGKNHLGSLNKRMKRAEKWLNKHTCGGFDWAAQFTAMFNTEALKEYLTNLGDGVVAAAPMALLSAFSPELAEIVKWLKINVNFDLTGEKNHCERIQNILTTGIRKTLWANEHASCMEQHTDVRSANASCNRPEIGSVTMADGSHQTTTTSEAAATSGNWLSNGVGWIQDKISSWYAPESEKIAAADTLARGGAEQSVGDQQRGIMGGIRDFYQNSSVGKFFSGGRGGALLDTAKSLFGEVKLTGSGSLELGRKRITLFKLELDSSIVQMREDFRQQLLTHYDSILSHPTAPTPTDILASYDAMRTFTYHARGSDTGTPPWANAEIVYGDRERHAANAEQAGGELITDHTMDACAWLLYFSYRLGGSDDQVKSRTETRTRVSRFVDALVKYECYLYLLREMRGALEHLKSVAKVIPASGTEDNATAARAMAQAEEALRDFEDILLEREWVVTRYLPEINSFTIPRFSHSEGGMNGSLPGATQPHFSNETYRD